jgi:hypothetical protein
MPTCSLFHRSQKQSRRWPSIIIRINEWMNAWMNEWMNEYQWMPWCRGNSDSMTRM